MTKVCPTCAESKPRREFRIFDNPVYSCRACRHRAVMRQRYHDKKETDRLCSRVARQADRNEARTEAAQMAAYTALMQKAYNRATATTRARLRDMLATENPRPRTRRAIAKRQELLARYEAAFKEQHRLLASGVLPPSIHDLVK